MRPGAGQALIMFGIIGALAFSAAAAPADPIADVCNGTNGALPKAAGAAVQAKQSVNDGHYTIAKQQAVALQRTADQCVAADQDPRTYAYVHAFGVMIEAARLALGDMSGKARMQQGIREAQLIENDPRVDPDLRKLAKDIVYGGQLLIKRVQNAKPAELITPPPTAPP